MKSSRKCARSCGAGAKEIVLSGINLGSYGRDLAPRAALGDVVRRILDETDLDQLRFSSIEPQDVTEDFVALVASSRSPRAAFSHPAAIRLRPHPARHAPLVSLRALRRARETHPPPAARCGHRRRRDRRLSRARPTRISAPRVEFIERLPFTYLHVFSFSERPGTAAASLGDRVPLQTIRERARALRDLAQRKSDAFRAAQAGRTVRALTLARGGEGWTEALTGNYLKVRIRGTPSRERMARSVGSLGVACHSEVRRRSVGRGISLRVKRSPSGQPKRDPSSAAAYSG